jgi:putative hydrolase of HD superfamily
MGKLADFIYSAGMLKRTPRSGWLTIGEAPESVADHSFRTALIGYVLCKMEDVGEKEELSVLRACIFHDLEEARLGDLHRTAKNYVKIDRKTLLADTFEGLGFADEAKSELGKAGVVGELVRDADLLDMIAEARELEDRGNRNARAWIENASKSLKTASAKKLLRELLATKPKHWLLG